MYLNESNMSTERLKNSLGLLRNIQQYTSHTSRKKKSKVANIILRIVCCSSFSKESKHASRILFFKMNTKFSKIRNI